MKQITPKQSCYKITVIAKDKIYTYLFDDYDNGWDLLRSGMLKIIQDKKTVYHKEYKYFTLEEGDF